MNVLRRSHEALVPNGTMLDLQVIRPDPRVETVDGRLLCEADGEPLFEYADAAREGVDLFIKEGLLEIAWDDERADFGYRDPRGGRALLELAPVPSWHELQYKG